MANVVTISPANLRGGPCFPQIGMIPFSIAVSDTYATATGGITVDFIDVLATIPEQLRPVHADLVRATGRTILGYLAVFTKGADANEFTVKLWNGTTEFSDGAVTQTLVGELFFTAGAKE